jgi:hypothetical protein
VTQSIAAYCIKGNMRLCGGGCRRYVIGVDRHRRRPSSRRSKKKSERCLGGGQAPCAGCPVRAPCLAEALVDGDSSRDGIWSGASIAERPGLRKRASPR